MNLCLEDALFRDGQAAITWGHPEGRALTAARDAEPFRLNYESLAKYRTFLGDGLNHRMVQVALKQQAAGSRQQSTHQVCSFRNIQLPDAMRVNGVLFPPDCLTEAKKNWTIP